MPYLIGTDEAGFGPNLGPLVITATVWHVPEPIRCEQLYEHLAGVIAPLPGGNGNGRSKSSGNGDGEPPLTVADSKRLYRPGGGLAGLERAVLSTLRLLGHEIDLWSEVWDALVPDVLPRLARIPWYADHDEPVPIDADVSQIGPTAERLAAGLDRAGVRLLAIRSDAIFPSQWNELLRLHETKGAALSHRSLALAAGMVAALDGRDDEPIAIACDKHGGRNRYARLLAEYFPDGLIEIHGEGRQQSLYRFGPAERRVECCFRVRAESLLPVALASVCSKYLRELAMRAMNRFWTGHCPGLRPTAGYPADARRYKEAITPVQKQLGIGDDWVWRQR